MTSVFFYHSQLIIGGYDSPLIVLSLILPENICGTQYRFVHLQMTAAERASQHLLFSRIHQKRGGQYAGCPPLKIYKVWRNENIHSAVHRHHGHRRNQVRKIDTGAVRFHQHGPSQAAADKDQSQHNVGRYHRHTGSAVHLSGQVPLDTGHSHRCFRTVKYPVHVRQLKGIMLTAP